MHDNLSYEHDQFFLVQGRIAHATVLLNGVRYADGQSNDKYDDQHYETNEQVASNLTPHAQYGPDDDRHEDYTQCDVAYVGPFEPRHEPTHRIAYYVVVEERTYQ